MTDTRPKPPIKPPTSDQMAEMIIKNFGEGSPWALSVMLSVWKHQIECETKRKIIDSFDAPLFPHLEP